VAQQASAVPRGMSKKLDAVFKVRPLGRALGGLAEQYWKEMQVALSRCGFKHEY